MKKEQLFGYWTDDYMYYPGPDTTYNGIVFYENSLGLKIERTLGKPNEYITFQWDYDKNGLSLNTYKFLRISGNNVRNRRLFEFKYSNLEIKIGYQRTLDPTKNRGKVLTFPKMEYGDIFDGRYGFSDLTLEGSRFYNSMQKNLLPDDFPIPYKLKPYKKQKKLKRNDDWLVF